LFNNNILKKKERGQLLVPEKSNNWTESFADIFNQLRLVSSDVIKRLKEFAKLGENWDSYGAKPIKWSTISRAIDFFYKVIVLNPDIAVPFISPAGDGSINFEWEVCSKILTHKIPENEEESFEYVAVDKSSGEVKRIRGRVSTIDGVVEKVTDWMT